MESLFIGVFSGFIYTFLSIAPMILVMRYALTQNSSAALLAGFGSTCAQMVWASIAVLGLAFSHFHLVGGQHVNSIKGYDESFVMLAALVLGFMAFRILQKPIPDPKSEGVPKKTAFFSLFMISMLRPIRIVGYAALFSLLGAHRVSDRMTDNIFLVIGTGAGAMMWWAMFGSIISKYRDKASTDLIRNINRVGAILLLIMAVSSLVYVFLMK